MTETQTVTLTVTLTDSESESDNHSDSIVQPGLHSLRLRLGLCPNHDGLRYTYKL